MWSLVHASDLAGVERIVRRQRTAIDHRDRDGDTPLIMACRPDAKRGGVAAWLIRHGAKLDLQNNNGWNALMFASRYGQNTTVKLLITSGAKLDLADCDGWTALMMACRNGHTEATKLLAATGSGLDLRNCDGATALMIAAEHGELVSARAIVASKANLNLQDKEERTALMGACRHKHVEIAQLLVAAGADLDVQDENGWTALFFAIAHDLPQIAHLLILKGADIQIESGDGWTALSLAARHGQADTVRLLLDRGTEPHHQDNQGFTPLMLAARNAQPQIVQLLLKHGADLEARSKSGATALMLCCTLPFVAAHSRNDLLQCAKLLVAAGADLGMADCAGRTALDYAQEAGRFDAHGLLAFLNDSEIAAVLGRAGVGPPVAVCFFEHGLHSVDAARRASEQTLIAMGLVRPSVRRAVRDALGPAAADAAVGARRVMPASIGPASVVPRTGRSTRGGAARQHKGRQPLNEIIKYDVFLSHCWGDDERGRDNHGRVAKVNARLRRADLATWFDEDHLTGDMTQEVADGARASRFAVLFVTQRYMNLLGDRGGANCCRSEFIAAARFHSPESLIIAIMEPGVLDARKWRAPFNTMRSSAHVVDFSSDAKLRANFDSFLSIFTTLPRQLSNEIDDVTRATSLLELDPPTL